MNCNLRVHETVKEEVGFTHTWQYVLNLNLLCFSTTTASPYSKLIAEL